MPAGRPTKTIEQIFSEMLDNYEPVTESGCWIWSGGTNGCGYGMNKVKGKTVLAHRLSAAMVIGRMPHGSEVVMHKCDVPSCINPRHLVVGTQAENMKDMIGKRRGSWQK